MNNNITNEQRIEDLNRNLIYWNTKMFAATSSVASKKAYNKIKKIELEFNSIKK